MPRVGRVVDARNRTDSLQSRGRMAPRLSVKTLAAASDPDAASTEEGGNQKRSEEAKEAGIDAKRPPQGGDPPPPGSWQWTLNWDPITYTEDRGAQIIIGSCPRSAADIQRLKQEIGIDAIVSLQSDVCMQAMNIDFDPLYQEACKNNILYTRVPVYDFDRIDQAAMLPEMVRRLASMIAVGRRTYVHCTAGINRATLTVLGYLTFVKGMELNAALELVQTQRPQAYPYVDCWKLSRERQLAGKEHDIYLLSQQKGNSMDEGGDWILRDWEAAATKVLQAQFVRAVDSDVQAMAAAVHLSMAKEKNPEKIQAVKEEEKKEVVKTEEEEKKEKDDKEERKTLMAKKAKDKEAKDKEEKKAKKKEKEKQKKTNKGKN